MGRRRGREKRKKTNGDDEGKSRRIGRKKEREGQEE